MPENIDPFQGDLVHPETITRLKLEMTNRKIHGIVVNSSGPPAKSFQETNMNDWDETYRSILRWKVEFIKAFLPDLEKQGYGRVLFIESASVKQPMDNMVLSTSLRLAVTGMMKSLSREKAAKGVTFNMIAPGYHLTPAVERVIKKKSDLDEIPFQEAKSAIEAEIPLGKMGDPSELAILASWLLSPLSAYVTGQVFVVDGGISRGTL